MVNAVERSGKRPSGRTKFGKRLRRVRETLGLTQLEAAKRLGLSPSYLNLIEHDRRPLTAKLAARFSEVFDTKLDVFSPGETDRVAVAVAEVLADPLFAGRAIDQGEIRDGVGASVQLGGALLDLYRAYREARDAADDLSAELRKREVLSAMNYEFRSIVTSIRSFAEILRDNPDLDVEQRRQFVEIVATESKRLVPLIGGLLEMDVGRDGPAGTGRQAPAEEVADFLQINAGHLPELEDAADNVRVTIGLGQATNYQRLAECVTNEPDRPPEDLSLEARPMAVARRIAKERCDDVIQRCADTVPWASAEARTLAIDALADYVAAAILMPYGPFLAAAREVRHDVERLQRRFGVGFEPVCRRLTTLQRPGAKGVPFHIVKVDMAGNVIWHFGTSGHRVPRFGGLCSLWNIHAAFLAPGITRTQLSRMPDGSCYFSIARAIRSDEPENSRLPRFNAIELGCDVSFARDLVYADGLDLAEHGAVPVGPTCRLCNRLDCTARVLPPFRQPASVAADPAIR